MFGLTREEINQVIKDTKNSLNQPRKTTADFIYPEYLEDYMTEDNIEYIKQIARGYGFTYVKLHKSTQLK